MLNWIRQWRQQGRAEDDLAEELRAHLAIEVRQRVDAGEDPIQAEHAARRAFGSVAKIQEDTRQAWGWVGVDCFLNDVRFGLRKLGKTPAWTVIICSMLALGIGLSTAIFSVVYSVLLQPLPYPQPERLMALWPSAPNHGYSRFYVSAALWRHWMDRAKSFEDIALTRPIANFNLTGYGPPARLEGARTSANLTAVLGVKPLVGRFFTEEERQSGAPVAVLSHALWKRRFGGDPAIVGRKIPLNGSLFEVIGVMPSTFHYPNAAFELWTPLYLPPGEFKDGQNYQYLAVGRLKNGVSMGRARDEMSNIMRRLAEELPGAYRTGGDDFLQVLVEPLAQSDAVHVRATLYTLMAAAGCLLLIGCMNLAVLLLARASARAREIAVRAALGASRGRLVRQTLAEMLPLSLAGAAGGTLLAWWGVKFLVPLLPANTPRSEAIGLHAPVLAFAVAASIAVVMLAGILPARGLSMRKLSETLQRDSRTATGAGSGRSVLVICQTAVTLVVLVIGALFVRSLQASLHVDPGFSANHVLTMHLAVTRDKYQTDQRISDYYDRLIDRVRSVPGVTAAGIVNRLPLSGIAQTGSVEFEGKGGTFDTDWRSATPGYFEAIGIPLRRGRLFAHSDRAESPPVGLIDEQLAHKVFGATDPVGQRFRISLAGFQGPWTEIVGVVGHILNDTPERDLRPQVYWPEGQRAQDRGVLVASTAGDSENYTAAIMEQIRRENPDQPVYDVRTMKQWLLRTLQSRILMTGMVSLFGGASLLLACLGLYGVVSYTAALRMREFGIRMALGASAWQILGMVLRHSGKLVLLGAAAGLLLAWPAAWAARDLLFGVTSGDSIAWVTAPMALLVMGLVGGLGPARRAGRTEAAHTLRAE